MPEYELANRELEEVNSFLTAHEGFRPEARAANMWADISVATLDGEPLAIIQKGFILRRKKTIVISREIANEMGESGIRLRPIKKNKKVN